MKTTLLIDGNAVAYTINVNNCKNEKDFARQFLLRIREYAKQFSSLPKALLFFDDKAGGNWREQVFPDYQRNRKEAYKKYSTQQKEESEKRSKYLLYLQQQIENSRYGFLHYPHTETDDLISLYCNNIQQDNEKVVILTTDKDLFQLIKEDSKKPVQVLFLVKRKLIKDEKIGKEALENKIWLGDNSDNIPGVCKNVGKANIDNLKKFLYSVEVYENSTGEKINITEVKEMKELSKTLDVKYIPSFSNFSLDRLKLNEKLINLSYVVKIDKKQNNRKTNYMKEVKDKYMFSPFSLYSIKLN